MEMNDMKKLIAKIGKNAREDLHIDVSRYKDFDLVGMRIWIRGDPPDGKDIPTSKGFGFQINLLPVVIDALQRAAKEARIAGLLTEPAQD